jgi:hypothetical protein
MLQDGLERDVPCIRVLQVIFGFGIQSEQQEDVAPQMPT